MFNRYRIYMHRLINRLSRIINMIPYHLIIRYGIIALTDDTCFMQSEYNAIAGYVCSEYCERI